MNPLAFIALGVLVAVCMASVALVAAMRAFRNPKELRRAFEALEEEFDDQRDHVRQALGRISRLKRAVQEGTVVAPAEGEGADSNTSVPALSDQPTLPGLTPRQSALNAQILARRKGRVM